MTTPRAQSTDADRAFERFRRTGDADALGAVYDELAPGLLRLALKLLGDMAAAEDVLQATFVTAIQSADRHDGERPVAPWLAGEAERETDPRGIVFTTPRDDLAPVVVPFARLDPAGETYAFRLEATGRIEATVLDADGAPRTYRRLRLDRRDPPRTPRTRVVLRGGLTDATGRTTLASVPTGVYDLSVDGESYGTLELAPGETITVTLSPVDDD